MMRSLLAYACLTGLSVAMVVTFSLMWAWDMVKVAEPNVAVRTIELVTFVALTGLGIERLCHWVKVARRERK